ncbi:hypothetical protein JQ597_32645 [Bradyrhizobium sp. AUGA SZCCT0177]|uniref:hypothetical protein n=1 Tax=Bradyrhizobium sp. AUGA SZCCT0177 TaxID=2807665 RepID=UPI001BA6239F|nr:hypothetical protein [Bradyrhizobium sp. AUGA SZCCT0177]MBR1286815.1 hypothetical protein [Bradyrhizobium sp. AUGA SZCCT0177]
MHEAVPRGSLLINGKNIREKQLAGLCGARSVRESTALLTELEAAGVFSRDQNGIIFSRRMKRDEVKAERDKANGKTGGNPRLNAGVNPQDKAQRPEARSQNPEAKSQKEQTGRTRASALAAPWTEADRERFWAAYPNKIGKAAAMKAFDQASRKVMPEVLFPALDRYANKSDDRPFCNPSTWLHQERWLDQPAAQNHGQRPYNSPGKRAGNDFLAGMCDLAADIAGNNQARGPADTDIPVGRINIDG